MEISLAGCLMAALLWRVMRLPIPEQTIFQAIATGFLASAMVLARLDTALLVISLAIVLVIGERKRWRRLLIHAIGFSIGGFLVPSYLLFNRFIFGTWIPVSGQAKQLRNDFTPTLRPLQSLIELEPRNIVFVFPGIAVTAIGLMLLVLGRPHRLARSVRLVAAAALLVVPFFYAIYSMTSDWQLWFWYLYPFALTLGIGGALFAAELGSELRTNWLRPAATAIVIAFAYLYIGIREANRPPETNYIYMVALDISRFARSHPGTYAMGDRAGTVSYFLNERLILDAGHSHGCGFSGPHPAPA